MLTSRDPRKFYRIQVIQWVKSGLEFDKYLCKIIDTRTFYIPRCIDRKGCVASSRRSQRYASTEQILHLLLNDHHIHCYSNTAKFSRITTLHCGDSVVCLSSCLLSHRRCPIGDYLIGGYPAGSYPIGVWVDVYCPSGSCSGCVADTRAKLIVRSRFVG